MDKETIEYLFTDLDDSQTFNTRDETKSQLIETFSYLNCKSFVFNEQSQYCSFRFKNLEHFDKSTFF